MKAALMVIDMQNAFCRREGTMGRLGFNIDLLRAPIPRIQELILAAHENNVFVIFTRYVYQPDYSDGGILISELFPQIREQGGLREGTWDVELIEELHASGHDIIIDKNRYSAFYKTELDSILQGAGIDTLVVTGVTTNMCVESTVRDAHYRDYRVLVVRDATGEVDPVRHEGALLSIQHGFGWVICAEEALVAFRTVSAPASD